MEKMFKDLHSYTDVYYLSKSSEIGSQKIQNVRLTRLTHLPTVYACHILFGEQKSIEAELPFLTGENVEV